MSLLKYFCAIFVFFSFASVFAQDNNDDTEKKSTILKLDEVRFKFADNKQDFDESTLEGIINTTKSDNFLRSEFYTDSKRIQKYYFDNGFLDAFVDTSTAIGSDSSMIIATFIINENTRYKINKVFYNGLEDINEQTYSLVSNDNFLKNNRNYNKAEVQLEITRVLGILLNNGYALAQADVPDIVKFVSKDSALANRVDIVLNFTPRSRFNFGRTNITISNNSYGINSDDIRRELEYKEGELYSKEKLISSENRISKIAIFQNARIQIDEIDSLEGVINLKIDAAVTNKFELKPEILAYDIGGRFYAGAGLTFSNKYFFGGGRVFTASLKALIHSFNFYRYEGLTTLFQPHLFDNDKITGNDNFGITSQRQLYNDSLDYQLTSVKNLASLKYELKNYTYFNNLILDWKIANERTIIFDTLLSIVNPVYNDFTSSIGLSVIHNHVDNLQYPTDGSYASYSFEEAGLLGTLVRKIFNTSTSSYLKVTTQNKFFWNLSEENKGASVFGTKLVVGNIFEYGDNTFELGDVSVSSDIVPTDANYTIGGSVSLRGWRAGTLGAVESPSLGGRFIIDGSFEHRTKPFSKSKNLLIKDLGFATFFDYGNIWDSYKDFQFNQIAMAIGAGIRYYTIVGAFRFDLGFKLFDPGVDDKRWLFDNNIGTIFKSGEKMVIQFGIGNTF